MAVNDFDSIAPFYDCLAKLVFGKSLLEAQLAHISEIREKDHVLILGGGTGEILEHIPFCKSVDYVEKSKQMIRRAERRQVNLSINFIHHSFLTVELNKQYDIIICPFFLDCFGEENLLTAISTCKQKLTSGGKMIVIDFAENSSDSWIVKLMHFFFRITANLESRNLKNIHIQMLYSDFQLIDEKFSHRNKLFSRLYRNL
ncbi:class I SAM-dependent methyltransferase [Ekhidna sp.]|uniref:class I SAM-dependent methyltransferase n=1 Tax=Ekhidna sp. TaxID=2608089 RepID=UPI003B5BDD1D